MAKTLQFRRGTSGELDAITGAEGEIFVDLDTNRIRVHDGVTQGGIELPTLSETTSNVNITGGSASLDTLTVGSFVFPTTGGSNGQVLSTDGSGALSFIDGGGGGLEEDANGDITVTPSGGDFTIDGDLTVTGDVTSLSDEREKENVEVITDALELVSGLEGVYYNFKAAPDNRSVGLIAQQTETVLPEVVYDKNGKKTIAYGNIIGVLVEAIKELKDEVEELKRGV